MADVAAAREKVGAGAPEVVYAPPWAEHPRFIDAMVERAADGARGGARPRGEARRAPDLHRAQRARRDGGGLALRAPARGRGPRSPDVSAMRAGPSPTRAGAARRAIRGSSPTSATRFATWRAPGRSDVVVAPIGFVCDHVEVLYDLDVEARALAAEAGPALPPGAGRQRSSRVHRDARRSRRQRRRAPGEAGRRRRRHRGARRRAPRRRARRGSAGVRSSWRSSRPATGSAAPSRPSATTDSSSSAAPTRSSPRSRGRSRSAGGSASRTGWCAPTTASAAPSSCPGGVLHPLPDGFQLLAPTRLRPVPRLEALLLARQAPDGARSRAAARRRPDESLGAFVRRPARPRGARARRPAAGRGHLHRRPRRALARRHHAALSRARAARAERDPRPVARGAARARGGGGGRAARAGRSS